MTSDGFQVFLVVAAVWATAISVRAIRALKAGGPYHLVWWEGGLMNAGKSLNPSAVKVKAVLAPPLAVLSILMVAGVVPLQSEGWTALMVLTIVLAVNDFMRATKDSGTEPSQ